MNQSKRKQIAEETLQIIRQGYYVNRNGEKVGLENNNYDSIDEVELYSPEILECLESEERQRRSQTEADAVDDCAFFLVDADSFLAAAGSEKVLVMNFANAHHPGGGFLNGASAQEESLCRASTLYASIGSEKATAMYRYNNEIKSPVDSDYLLISPNVTVFRDKDGALLDTPYQVAVATVAAPNRNGRAGNVPLSKLNAVMKNRLRRFLCAASASQYQTLVLGAWGCGAFGNDPNNVAQIFYDLFFEECFKERFQYVIFAVLGGGANYEAFRNVFSSEIEDCSMPESNTRISSGYVEAALPFPICNHTAEVGKENLGYTQGILADGTPFEAELWENAFGLRCLSIIIPEQKDFWRESEAQSQEGITTMRWIAERHGDCSVLPIGMVIQDRDVPWDELAAYTDYLEKMGIVKFKSYLLEGSMQALTDIEGNSLMHDIITLVDNGQVIATTQLVFKPFPNQPKSGKLIRFDFKATHDSKREDD